MAIERVVPDTSVLIEGIISEKILGKELGIKTVIIHEAALAELEHQANQGHAIGFLGLDEVKRIKDLATEGHCEIAFDGVRPSAAEIRHASLGEIDAKIRLLAYDSDATLVTSDKVQSEVARARGVQVMYFKQSEKGNKKLKLEKFFDEITMSVHLKEQVCPYAKKGKPGAWEFVQLRKALLKQEEIADMSREIIEEAKLRRDSFIEIERTGSTIVQLGNFRIVITKPPFSDGWEITAVRPVKKMGLSDYQLSEQIMDRIDHQADGILVAGSPGMGKSTFSAGLIEYYSTKDKIVKTVEAPRDLVLPDSVTQYAISHGDAQEIHDILLLSRPDYTLFDEMRNTDDFKLFADLRLAGVGMVGVVHATNPIDAIQRFLGRIEMGVIPQVVDTVFFIKNGNVDKILSLRMTVKVPAGMTEADLARPVVEVSDFQSGQSEYEIYSYGEQTVVIPVKETQGNGEKKGMHMLAESSIEAEFKRLTNNAVVDVTSDHGATVRVPERDIARIIGKQGKNIDAIEKKLGIKIDVQSLDDAPPMQKKAGRPIDFEIEMKKASIIFHLDITMQHKDVDILVDNEYLLTAKAGKTGLIKVKRNNPLGRELMEAISRDRSITLVV